MSGVGQAVFMNQRSFGTPPGSESFTTAGTFTWVAPPGVTKVSAVVVGGAAGGGAALRYANNLTVTPGTSYTVAVGAGGTCTGIKTSISGFFLATCDVNGVTGGTGSSGTGGNGGGGAANQSGGGGGAGGYSGNGGAAGFNSSGVNGSGGAGGGGGGGNEKLECYVDCCNFKIAQGSGGAGGGVGLFGSGSSGAGGAGAASCTAAGGAGGGGGSGGNSGGSGGTSSTTFAAVGGVGGTFGGGGASGGRALEVVGGCIVFCITQPRGAGANGAARIVWPGCARSFPSTDVGSP